MRRSLLVNGLVQGVGFRPFVYGLAAELALTGSVANTPSGVLIEVEGADRALVEFARRLRIDAPALAVIENVIEQDQNLVGGTGFSIRSTMAGSCARTLTSPDVATCTDCLAEMSDRGNRRYRHPFISCTNCGPRYTIITALPYDRETTTMASFPMCALCRAEYEDPRDRRFHAQTIACHDCGPRLEFLSKDGVAPTHDAAALSDARTLLERGRILALKGIGGYHLVCDAYDNAVVANLRRRKHRGAKPLAVMVADIETARSVAWMTGEEEALLSSPRRPIVLLERRDGPAGRPVAAAVAPDSPDLGIMLAYTPLHSLLFTSHHGHDGPRALVVTSGNLAGEVIVAADSDAVEKLGTLADGWLRHDRRIEVPCDDSVTSVLDGKELPVRRSRGYAPLPIALPFDVPASLAAGADLKGTCAVADGRYAWVSQHLGDMDDLSTLEALDATSRHLSMLTGVEPIIVVADQHPAYRSSVWARDRARPGTAQTVQHHHAHVASVMGENGLGRDDRAIGFAFDGTGYGADGAVWGGEVLIAGYKSFQRVAHLGYVGLAGGDASVQRPYRMALSHLVEAGVEWDEKLPCVRVCPMNEREVLTHQLTESFNTVPTSSMGRLFDSVSSIIGLCQENDFEAQAAIALESAARLCTDEPASYTFGIATDKGGDSSIIADPTPVIRAIAADVMSGMPARSIAAGFHRAVADLVLDLTLICRQQTDLDVVALAGGVFQNRFLTRLCEQRLASCRFTVLRARLLPPNDGGLALGQILVGAAT